MLGWYMWNGRLRTEGPVTLSFIPTYVDALHSTQIESDEVNPRKR